MERIAGAVPKGSDPVVSSGFFQPRGTVPASTALVGCEAGSSAPAISSSGATVGLNEARSCSNCSARAAAADSDSTAVGLRYYAHWDISLCRACQYDALIPQSKAIKEFALSVTDLSILSYETVRNPVMRNFSAMKLYLKRDVKELSLDIWGGSADAIAVEVGKRALKSNERKAKRATAAAATTAAGGDGAAVRRSKRTLSVDRPSYAANDVNDVAGGRSDSGGSSDDEESGAGTVTGAGAGSESGTNGVDATAPPHASAPPAPAAQPNAAVNSVESDATPAAAKHSKRRRIDIPLLAATTTVATATAAACAVATTATCAVTDVT